MQDELPTWFSYSDDNMGLESMSEPDGLDLDDDEDGLEVNSGGDNGNSGDEVVNENENDNDNDEPFFDTQSASAGSSVSYGRTSQAGRSDKGNKSEKDTNRNDFGYVDYERIYGVEGIGIANTVSNVQEYKSGRGQPKKLKSYITFDDGSNWSLIPSTVVRLCRREDNVRPFRHRDSLHFHSFTTLVAFFPLLLRVLSWVLGVLGKDISIAIRSSPSKI